MHYGETMGDPKVTMLLLRAWMLWRVGNDGWVKEKTSRSRQFDEETITLQRDIMAIQQQLCPPWLEKKGAGAVLLGNKRADGLLRHWVPHIITA